ncbi:hypothetical protein B0T10DRAFT_182506 [Thelonectria olida]|uniref:Zn(2)-C6 fungal-type domain-containing protein n=1 Tax=Thelonectria olida TaxID=1576542 RepID=A0A9P8WH08_9HYPO|nr:hypothetical protein B0T10DRAFT_182506 [Thelonectria olida]
MVTPNNYPPLEGRRYGGRAGAYPPSYPERRQVAYPIYPEIRNSVITEDDTSSQRKRIAVACGRCRKRKIRCSGDSGNGSPCTNCKNAGHEPCQYLRVASQETQMKQDSFTYSLEASRQYHARGSTLVPPLPVQQVQSVSQYPEEMPALHGNEIAYRHNSASFTYNARPFDPVTPWPHGLPVEQSVSYNVYSPASAGTHFYDQEIGLPYRPGGHSSAVSSSSRDAASVCVDQEPAYTTTLVHRAAPGSSGDSTGMTFQSMQNGHADASTADATAVVASERILPTPVGHRGSVLAASASCTSGLSSYRNDSSSPVYGSGKQPASSQSPQTSTSSTAPVTPSSEASGYTSYEPSSSMPPVVPSYAPMALASQLTRSNDLYGPSSAGSAMYSPSSHASTGGDSFRGSGSGPDMTYRYTDTTTATTENGTPTVGSIIPKLERHSSPSTEAAIALTHPPHQHQHQHHHAQHHAQHQQHMRHHHRQTFVAQNHGRHALCTMPSEQEASGSEAASADGERKPAVLHT